MDGIRAFAITTGTHPVTVDSIKTRDNNLADPEIQIRNPSHNIVDPCLTAITNINLTNHAHGFVIITNPAASNKLGQILEFIHF